MVRIKRAYEPAEKADGTRVLVDRLWPRGVRKEALKVDSWLKEVGPSTPLRKWFGHDPEKWSEFSRRYREELKSEPGRTQLSELKSLAKKGTLTLVFGAKDEAHSNAAVLQALLDGRSRST